MKAETLYRDVMGIEDPELVRALSEYTARRHLDRGEYLIRMGETQTVIPFLEKGVMRGSYLAEDGTETTDCLETRPGYPIVAGVDFTQPAPVDLSALTDCDLMTVPVEKVTELLEQNPQALLLYNRMLREAFNTYWVVRNKLSRGTAMERYTWFLEAYPGLIDQIGNRYVASFLGMTPVTLSRLRGELRAKEKRT